MIWVVRMRLSQASDFALRILMLLASQKEPVTIEVMSEKLGLVKSHVMKISAKLRKAGIVESQRGRIGGVSLAYQPSEISVGQVVRIIEPDFAVVECMQNQASMCSFMPSCKLRKTIRDATDAFLSTLDKQTLDGLITKT